MKTYTEDDLRDALRLLEQLVPRNADAILTEPANRRGTPPRQWLMAVAAAAVVATIAIAGAALTAGRHSAPSSHTGHGIQAPGGHSKFPLSHYRPSPTQDDLLYDARYTLANKCLRARHSAQLLPTHIISGTDFAFTWTTGLRPTTVADAQRYGYRLPPTGDSGMSAAQRRLLTTPNGRDCVAQADRTLMGPAAEANTPGGLLSSDQNYVDDLIAQSAAKALASPAIAAKNRAWSSCMSANGFPGFRSPGNAIQHADLNSPLTRGKWRQAVQDAKCKVAVAFTPTVYTVVSTNQKALVTKNVGRLTAIYHRLEATLARAHSVVSP